MIAIRRKISHIRTPELRFCTNIPKVETMVSASPKGRLRSLEFQTEKSQGFVRKSTRRLENSAVLVEISKRRVEKDRFGA